MNTFFLDMLKFLLFTSAFYIAALFLWGSNVPQMFKPNVNYNIGSYGHMHSRIADIKNYDSTEIVVLGSSHAYRGIDPRILLRSGYKVFNLGSSAQSPIQAEVLLNRYLDVLNPKTVLYEVYPETFVIDGVESSLDIIANDKNDLQSLKMAQKINNARTYNTLAYGFIRDFLNLNESFIEPTISGKDKYISGGFVEREVSFYRPMQFKKGQIIINKKQIESFNGIVKLLKSRNIELVLVYAPITKVKYASYSNSGYFDSLMRKHSNYYNFNTMPSLSLTDSLHFYDSHHLNQRGVEIFDEKLVEILKEE